MLTLRCENCGRGMSRYPSAVKAGRGRFCSHACRARSGCNAKHGQSRTRLYAIWHHMKTRCKGRGKTAAKYYRDRGIRVCDEWANSFEAFRDWSHANGYAEDLEIDRRDNAGGYSPENCRWATRKQQMANTRKRSDAKTSQFKGVSWCANVSKWRAQIQINGKHRHIGVYVLEEEAAKAYDREARREFGEFAHTNFKE